MSRLFSIFLSLLLLSSCTEQLKTPDGSLARVDSILQQLTLTEKVGQMTQINLPVILKREDGKIIHPPQLDPALLSIALDSHHVGSFLNTADQAMDRETWLHIMNGIFEHGESGNHIPIIYGIDAIHGANYTNGSTIFPHQLMQAATFNDSLVGAAASITGYECRASGIPWVFSPILDLGRQPLWTQFFETFGEDVYLAECMSRATVLGYQHPKDSRATVAASAKHFVGSGHPFTGRDRTPVQVGERMLREVFLPPFRSAIDAGVKTVMVGTSEIDGIPLHVNSYLLQEVLREELGFEGVVISDWGDIENLHRMHKVSPDNRTSVKMAINAGIDMVMVPNDYHFTNDLIDLVESGEISEDRIDASVRRILQLKEDLGLLDGWQVPTMDDYPEFGGSQHQDVAYALAAEGITLLKNEDNILPLSPNQRVLVCGPAADNLVLQHGSWTRTWQGNDTFITGEDHTTIAAALQAKSMIVTVRNTGTVDSTTSLQNTLADAKRNDAIVLCLGEKPSTEKPGDISNLNISDAQYELASQLLNTGKPVVLVLMQNRPQILRGLAERCAAVVYAYQPGNQGGQAIADALYGEINPSGKLPFTYPKDPHAFLTYDHKTIEKMDADYGMNAFDPQWPFGHGLSYTTFEVGDPTLNHDSLHFDDTLKISVSIINTGERAGKEVVMVYVSDEIASVTRPGKQLKAYQKAAVKPGQSQNLSIDLPIRMLAFVGVNPKEEMLEEGWHTLEVAGTSKRFYIHP